ncbi:MAG: ATP phosphoribosyltransferase regulatory subunit, partial [Pseudomonadota bacterium]
DKFGVEGVRQLLGDGRKDESGDFTKGAGLDEESAAKLIEFVEASHTTSEMLEGHPLTKVFLDGKPARLDGAKAVREAVFEVFHRNFSQSRVGAEGIFELRELAEQFEGCGYLGERIEIDTSVVRGLEYYTGPVFEAELLFEVTDEKTGQPVRFGSVGGGGRYDGLVSRFRGQPVPATGFSVGVSRLYAALKALGKVSDVVDPGPVVVCVMDKDQMAGYQAMAAELRSAGIRAEVFLGNPKQFGKQLQYADSRNAPVAIIEGSDERERGVIQIKDLIEGARAAEAIESHEAWK